MKIMSISSYSNQKANNQKSFGAFVCNDIYSIGVGIYEAKRLRAGWYARTIQDDRLLNKVTGFIAHSSLEQFMEDRAVRLTADDLKGLSQLEIQKRASLSPEDFAEWKKDQIKAFQDQIEEIEEIPGPEFK